MSPIARILTLLIFGGFGLVMLFVGITQHFQQRRLLAAARPVPAVILHSEVRTSKSADTDRRLLRDNSTTTHTPIVRFTYKVAGRPHESDLLYPCEILTSGSRESAIETLRPFPVGAQVTAFVDERHPDKAFLIPKRSAGPTVFIIIGVFLPPIAWLVGRYV
jgi:hypothetical protein